MNRPYKNPNRWMINHVPVRQEKHFDWSLALAFVALLFAAAWFAWALYLA